jgi:hypothetical protein
MIPLHQKQNDSNLNVANKYYEPSDYKKKNELSSGLAITHEQVSDTWSEGNSEAVIDDYDGKDIKIPRKGY